MESEALRVERAETGLRAALTIVFFIIARVLETVIVVVVLFELAWTLVTREEPSPRVRGFANRAVSYLYRLGRYLTYNDRSPPFPFADFPSEVEPPEAPEPDFEEE